MNTEQTSKNIFMYNFLKTVTEKVLLKNKYGKYLKLHRFNFGIFCTGSKL